MSADPSSSSKTSIRRRAPRGEGDRLRDEILGAAESLLVETGNEDLVSIRAIADAVGVTPPSIYRHFADKDELVMQLCERRFEDLNKAFDDAEAASSDPVERLKELGRAYANFALQHPEHYRVLMMTPSEMRAEEFGREDSQGRRAFYRLVEAVAACGETGWIKADDPVTTAVVLWSGIHGLVSLLITSPEFPWPDEPARLVERVLDSQMSSLLRM